MHTSELYEFSVLFEAFLHAPGGYVAPASKFGKEFFLGPEHGSIYKDVVGGKRQ